MHRLASISYTRTAKRRHLASRLPYHRARAFSPLILILRGVTLYFNNRRSLAILPVQLLLILCCGMRSTTTHIGIGYLNHVANALT
jgi:hypothetical protein